MPRERTTADLSIVTETGSLDCIAAAITLARQALAAAIAADPTRRLAPAATDLLRICGFSAVRIHESGDCALVAGEIPSFGPFVRISRCPTF